MPTLEELQNKYGKKEASEPETPIEANISKEVISEPRKIFISENIEKQKTKPQTPEKDIRIEINESLELNLIKSLYANRFGSTTNRTKAHMIRKIKNAWKY